MGINYKHFDKINTKVSQRQAREIIKWFFGDPPIPYPATENDCEFAQSILLAAVSASYLMSPFEKLVKALAKFNLGTKEATGFLKGVIIACGKVWWLEETVPVSAMEKEGIYQVVKDTVVLRFRTNHLARITTNIEYKW